MTEQNVNIITFANVKKKSNEEMRGRWIKKENESRPIFLSIIAESQQDLPEFDKSRNDSFTVLLEVINYTIRELK